MRFLKLADSAAEGCLTILYGPFCGEPETLNMNQNNANKIQPLGSYLAKKQGGRIMPIDQALEIQSELEKQGIYKPLGRIVVENSEVENAFLEECLLSQRVDILRNVTLFESLPDEALTELASVLKNVILPPGEIVCKPSDKGDTYYVIASGSVKVCRQEDGDADVTFAFRGPGEGFGEIALLTKAPHSATVETIEKTSLILIPRDAFLAAVFSHPASAKACARILAERLGRGYVQLVEEHSTEQAYRQFISEEMRSAEPMLIGNSAAVMKLVSEIDALAGNNNPVLVTGEPGAEMKDAAGLIHEMGNKGQGLLMGMDAKNISSAGARGDDPLFVALSQFAALFGRGQNALDFAPDRRLGLLTMALGGTVIIENIEYLSTKVQKKLADYIEKGRYIAAGETDVLQSNARIIATSSADLAALVADQGFDKRLYGFISAQTLLVPPLRRRKKDLRTIVEELIKRYNREMDKKVRGIDEEAYKSLMVYDWPGNTEELRVVIRRAVSLAGSELLMLEDLFIGPPPVTGKFTVNLLNFKPVMQLFQSRFYPQAARYISAPFIALIIGLGLFGPQAPDKNVVLILTWGMWQPMLIMSTFFAARIWCSVCPIGALSGMIRRFVGLNFKVPLFVRNYGFFISAALMTVIVWSEVSSGMLRSPRATALLVLSIVTLASITGFMFPRNTWCRYFCALGGMVGVLSSCSIIELRAHSSICNNNCKKHDCFIGSEKQEGCPMFEGPFSLSSNQHCVLCGSCIKTCPNQSPVLNLRLPGYELWSVRRPDKAFVVLGIALIGTQLFRGIDESGWFTLFSGNRAHIRLVTLFSAIAAFMLAALYARIAGQNVFGKQNAIGEHAWHRIVYALLPLSFAFEAGHHLDRLLTLSGQFLSVLGRQMGSSADFPGASASPAVVKTLQVFLVLLGLAASSGILGHLLKTREDGTRPAPAPLTVQGSWPVLFLALVYLWMFLARQ